MKTGWFEVDRDGLAKLLKHRGPGVVVLELLQNAWDQNVTRVDCEIYRISGTPYVSVVVADDDPNGFADLTHAYRLFAESQKKSDPTKRGRFNLGEKLVIACCREASIQTTTGTIYFHQDGTRTSGRAKTTGGSMFRGEIRMTDEELQGVLRELDRTIQPPNITTLVNGKPLPPRMPTGIWTQMLQTEVADAEGYLVKAQRQTQVRAYEPLPGETATLYEMGIPVVETGDRWHLDVQQKVPLTMDRTNVPPSYLAAVRTGCLNHMAPDLTTQSEATALWVKEASGHRDANPNAVRRVMDLRFGEKRVAYDPSDHEANKRATMAGYTVVHGGALSADEWHNVKEAGLVPPAGQVTPSPKPFSADGEPLKLVKDPTGDMMQFVFAARAFARDLIGVDDLIVKLADDPRWGFSGCYSGKTMTVNVASFGGPEFFYHGWTEALLATVIHEFAHHTVSDHLSDEFYAECCRLGARLTLLHMER